MAFHSKILFVIGQFVLFFSSCNVVEKIHFEVLVPADTVIELNNRNVDIVNTYFNTHPKPTEDITYEKWQYDSIMSFACIETLYTYLKESERFIPQRVDTVYNPSKSYSDRIELTNVDIRTTVLSEPYRDNYSGLYMARIRVDYWIDWTVFNNAKGATVFEKKYCDTVWVEGKKNTFSSLSDLVNIDKANLYILNKTAEHFAKTISPYWKGTYRYIFTTGHNDFTVCKYYISKNEWDKAEMLWQTYRESGNKNLDGKTNYNLAVKYEREGKFLQALEFASNSFERYGFTYAKELIGLLRLRINDVAIIENQIP